MVYTIFVLYYYLYFILQEMKHLKKKQNRYAILGRKLKDKQT